MPNAELAIAMDISRKDLETLLSLMRKRWRDPPLFKGPTGVGVTVVSAKSLAMLKRDRRIVDGRGGGALSPRWTHSGNSGLLRNRHPEHLSGLAAVRVISRQSNRTETDFEASEENLRDYIKSHSNAKPHLMDYFRTKEPDAKNRRMRLTFRTPRHAES
jgi:hypothetical protein